MEGDAARHGHVERHAAFAQVIGAVQARDRVDMDRLVRHARRDAFGDDVDRAADGLVSVKQHCGAAQYLDPLGDERVHGNGVVGRGGGRIERPDTVGQHANALAAEAAQDRAAGARREAAGGNARQLGEHFTDLAVHVALQVHAVEHRGAGQHVQPGDAGGGHDDRVMEIVGARLGAGFRRRGIGVLRKGGHGSEQRRREHQRETEFGHEREITIQ